MRVGKRIFAALTLTVGAVGLAVHGTGWGQATGQPAASSVAATSQQGTAQSNDTTLRVNTRETVVDVTVMDAKGHPVHDLKQSDFVVKEDGKPQPLRSFQVFSENTPSAVRTPPPLPPNVYTNLQQSPASSAVNILLLDALNTQAVDQIVMKQESLKYLKSMPRGTRIAVLGLTSSLRILQGFTSDPDVLMAVLGSKKNKALPSPFIDNDSGGVLDDQVDAQTELGNDDIAAGMQQFENELTSEQQDIRNRQTLEALNQIAAYVNGIKGRKNLIWFTEGMPLNMFPTAGGTNDLEEITDYAKDVRRTTDLLAAAEVAVYPVDVRRLFNNPANGADQGLSSINVHTAANQAVKQIQYRQKTGQEQVSMEAVAEATGGVAYFNTNDLKGAVDKAIENGANYYSLSYTPPDLNFDGRFHTIDVEVDRPSLHLTYRKGYNADDIVHNAITPLLPLTTSAPEPYGSNMQASMGRGVPTSSQMLFDVRVTPSSEPAKATDPPLLGTLDPKLQGKALVRYDVLYFIPAIASQIEFALGTDGSRKCSLEFDLAAYDVYGKRITGLSQTSNSPPLTAEQYQQFLKQKQFQFLQQLDLPPGEIFLRVGILDAVSQKVGTLEIPLNVTKKPAVPAAESGGRGGN
jgi:VWFA-related protein